MNRRDFLRAVPLGLAGGLPASMGRETKQPKWTKENFRGPADSETTVRTNETGGVVSQRCAVCGARATVLCVQPDQIRCEGMGSSVTGLSFELKETWFCRAHMPVV